MIFLGILCVLLSGVSSTPVPNGDIISYIRNVERIETKFNATKRSWKIQASNVCFGAKDNAYGRFKLKEEGRISAVKFVYRSGYVSCLADVEKYRKYRSNWGCGDWFGQTGVAIYVTDKYNRIVLPKTLMEKKYPTGVWYTLLGYDRNSKELVLTDYETAIFGTAGLELRIWYSEDLLDIDEADNNGRVCTDVYVMFD